MGLLRFFPLQINIIWSERSPAEWTEWERKSESQPVREWRRSELDRIRRKYEGGPIIKEAVKHEPRDTGPPPDPLNLPPLPPVPLVFPLWLVEGSVCKVGTQDPENLDEELKPLVTVWSVSLRSSSRQGLVPPLRSTYDIKGWDCWRVLRVKLSPLRLWLRSTLDSLLGLNRPRLAAGRIDGKEGQKVISLLPRCPSVSFISSYPQPWSNSLTSGEGMVWW